MLEYNRIGNSELKEYIKVHRNDEKVFHEALKVLMSRGKNQTYPALFEILKEEVEAIFRDTIKSIEEGKN